MDYSPEQFFRLNAAIQAEGGQLLDKLCAAREYETTGPKNKNFDGTNKPLVLAGCGNVCIFEVPYVREPIDGTNAAVRDTMELCAVCDDLGHMPRYEAAVGDA